MSEPSSAQRFAPIALWRVASGLLITLFNLFGEPQELARQHSMSATDHKLASNWLRCVEALFRKLLLIEASHYEKHVTQKKPRQRAKRERREMAFFPESPEAWRVTFRIMERGRPRPRLAGRAPAMAFSSRHAGEDARAPYHSAWPIAERFEALLRVHDNPAPYAKRLARRLYANPERIASIVSEPPELQHRIDPEPYADIGKLLKDREPVFGAAAIPSDTS
ncbi:MAG: hypothetical protein K2P70_05225 [Hyphomonadaceae bacterium]|nr:hypothetical protein [Hyphomonadaceae bacterium]